MMKIENQILKLLIDSDVNITKNTIDLISQLVYQKDAQSEKPDDRFAVNWNGVDEKYKYHAYDMNGCGYFYESKPTRCHYGYKGNGWGLYVSSTLTIPILSLEDSLNSLRSRPQH